VLKGQPVNDVALVVYWRVVGARGAEKARLRLDPVLRAAILFTLSLNAMVELDLENLNAWLGDGQIRHLDIQTMEVDAIKTLIDGPGQLALADLLNSHLVVHGTELVELSEQVVKLGEGARVVGVGGPEAP